MWTHDCLYRTSWWLCEQATVPTSTVFLKIVWQHKIKKQSYGKYCSCDCASMLFSPCVQTGQGWSIYKKGNFQPRKLHTKNIGMYNCYTACIGMWKTIKHWLLSEQLSKYPPWNHSWLLVCIRHSQLWFRVTTALATIHYSANIDRFL